MDTFFNSLTSESVVENFDRVSSVDPESVLPIYNDLLFNIDSEHEIINVENTINCDYMVEGDLSSFFNLLSVSQKSLNLMHLNCRSLRANFSEVESFILNSCAKYSAVAITETWLRCYN